MAVLSQQQIAQYAAQAGMSDPITMSAIAMAESSGRTDAHNPIPPDDSYGLWQINMIGSEGASRRAALGISSNTQLYDPAVNARAAAVILREQGPTAWSTYSSGAYAKYLPATDSAGKAVQAGWWDNFWNGFKKGFNTAPGPTIGDPNGADAPPFGTLGNAADAIGSIATDVSKAAAWMSQARNWVRVGYVIGGGALVLMGLGIVARPLLAGTPAGRIASAAHKRARGAASGAVKATRARGRERIAARTPSEETTS